MLRGKFVLRAVLAAAARPRLWPIALTQLGRFAPDRWWRRPPFLPLPQAGLARFRAETMYGDCTAAPSTADVVTWLEWCRVQARRRGPRRQPSR